MNLQDENDSTMPMALFINIRGCSYITLSWEGGGDKLQNIFVISIIKNRQKLRKSVKSGYFSY